MRIGIDARFLTHPQLGGFKTYTENLIRALSQIDDENCYVLYLDREPCNESLPQSKNIFYKVVPATFPIIGMPFREQILLREQFAKDKLDLVHFFCNTAPVKLPQKLILSLLDVIQVTTPQTFPKAKGLETYKRWAITEYSKWSILNTVKDAKKIITLSYFEKEKIAEVLKIPPERIFVTHMAPNAVYSEASPQVRDTWRFEMRRKLCLPDRFIMGVGYEPRKNIPFLIDVFSCLANQYPDLGLVIVAAQDERRNFFNQLASELNLDHRVIVLPAQKPEDLAVLYNLAEVFVFPSDRESFGAPPLEAIACGTPTVAMNMTSLPEILENGAILLDGKDVQTWADAISKVLTDQSLRVDLIDRGLQQAAKLTWQNCARKTIKVYEDVYKECSSTGTE